MTKPAAKDIFRIIDDEYALTQVLVEEDLFEKIRRAQNWPHFKKALNFLKDNAAIKKEFIAMARQQIHQQTETPKSFARLLFVLLALADCGEFLDPNQFVEGPTRQAAAIIFFKNGWN